MFQVRGTRSRAVMGAALAATAVLLSAPAEGAPRADSAVDWAGDLQAPPALADTLPGAGVPYLIGGLPWPGRSITYHLGVRGKKYRAGINDGIRAWNRQRLGFDFRAAPRSRARVHISNDPSIGVAGLATLGYPGSGRRSILKMNTRGNDRDVTGIVAAHELGHILGLDHPTSGCAVMRPSTGIYEDACGYEYDINNWFDRCRLLERDDLKGAQRLYGGRFTVSRRVDCPRSPVAAPVTGLRARPDPLWVARISWQPARRATSYLVRRSAPGEPCPTSYGDQYVAQAQYVRETSYLDTDSYRPRVRIGDVLCYSVWSANRDGYPKPSSRRSVTYRVAAPPVPEPTGITVSAGPAWRTGVRAMATPGRTGDQVEVMWGGSCPRTATGAQHATAPYGATAYLSGYNSGDRVCFRFWALGYSEVWGEQRSTPVDRWVTLP